MRSKVILSQSAYPSLRDHLLSDGHEVIPFEPVETLKGSLSEHPDMVFCKLKTGVVFKGDPEKLGPLYPGDIIYNACSTGKYIIHNFKYTDPELLDAADKQGLIRVNIRQGYGKCSILPVTEDGIITYDKGIYLACSAKGLKVLLIRPGHIDLPGYDTGFIGGASGRVGDAILFNGDLSAHPDHDAIMHFIEDLGLKVKYFKEGPLTDIGSIIEV